MATAHISTKTELKTTTTINLTYNAVVVANTRQCKLIVAKNRIIVAAKCLISDILYLV